MSFMDVSFGVSLPRLGVKAERNGGDGGGGGGAAAVQPSPGRGESFSSDLWESSNRGRASSAPLVHPKSTCPGKLKAPFRKQGD